MILLRRVIGDALRARRQGQHRTLREVSSTANVSLGYLSEIERGQKEPSSELLAAICDALGARLSDLLREVSDTMELAEQVPGVLLPVRDRTGEGEEPVPARPAAPTSRATGSAVRSPETGAVRGSSGVRTEPGVRKVATEGGVSVSVRQDSPLKATLRTTRRVRTARPDRDVVCAA